MTFADLLHTRRSVRDYRDDSVPVDLLQEIIRESTLAPSAGNKQPWQFVIVTSKPLLKAMSDESKQQLLDRMAANPQDYAKKYQRMLENASYNVYYNAPCLVLIGGPSDAKNLVADCALVACYFMLAAAARKLGTCWVNLGAEIHDPDMRQTLGMPDSYQIIAPIVVGYPVSVPLPPPRREAELLKVVI